METLITKAEIAEELEEVQFLLASEETEDKPRTGETDETVDPKRTNPNENNGETEAEVEGEERPGEF
ncbi:hypothetical protein EZY14_006135 [Kordia sp. TARA_039_SRF]|nr:hypothetical protein EZY14_006135 [Kordia sp. TARA_039_SRF]